VQTLSLSLKVLAYLEATRLWSSGSRQPHGWSDVFPRGFLRDYVLGEILPFAYCVGNLLLSKIMAGSAKAKRRGSPTGNSGTPWVGGVSVIGSQS
jgi:hypothetical protein